MSGWSQRASSRGSHLPGHTAFPRTRGARVFQVALMPQAQPSSHMAQTLPGPQQGHQKTTRMELGWALAALWVDRRTGLYSRPTVGGGTSLGGHFRPPDHQPQV